VGGGADGGTNELSFHFLRSKDDFIWVSIRTEFAILLSMCLQAVVDEMVRLKTGASDDFLLAGTLFWFLLDITSLVFAVAVRSFSFPPPVACPLGLRCLSSWPRFPFLFLLLTFALS
jgi:hypothetical protein